MILVFTEVATKVIGSHQQNRVHSTVCYSKWKTDQALLPPLTLPPPWEAGRLAKLFVQSFEIRI